MALNVGFDYEAAAGGFFRSFEATAAFDYSADRIDRRRFVSHIETHGRTRQHRSGGVRRRASRRLIYGGDDGRRTSDVGLRQGGGHIRRGHRQQPQHLHRGGRLVDGQELRPRAGGRPRTPAVSGLASRPRPYCDIPAQHDLALFAEANSSVAMGRMHLDAMAGVRAATMLNLSRGYSMRGRVWLDPRLNVRLSLPAAAIGGERIETAVAGGVGWHTKSPTMDQLYPAPVYYDFTQLSYFHNDPAAARQRPHVCGRSDELRPAARAQLQVGGARRNSRGGQPPLGDILRGGYEFGVPLGRNVRHIHI